MKSTTRGSATVVGPRWAWLFAVALVVALGPAAARGRGWNAAAMQPEQIRVVQRALQERGLHVEPTGAWDEPTHSALAEFQASKGLTRTGQLDRETSRALGLNPRALRPAGGGALSTWRSPDPMFNCALNNTIDCGPGGGG